MWPIDVDDKKFSQHLIYPLTLLGNSSLETGVFPSSLKKAKVVLIFRKDNQNKKTNSRPISILPSISKMFEKLFLDRLALFLDLNNLLSDQQYGTRKGKSAADAVVSLAEMIYNHLSLERPSLSVLLDFCKAFDCVDLNTLLQKVTSYGVRGLPWRSYFNDRLQVVQISKCEKLGFGVPQGSIHSYF